MCSTGGGSIVLTSSRDQLDRVHTSVGVKVDRIGQPADSREVHPRLRQFR